MIGYVQDITRHEADDEIFEVQKGKSTEEMKKDLAELLEKTPARQRAKYAPKFEWAKEYEDLRNTDTSNMKGYELDQHTAKMLAFKRNGGITEEWTNEEIEKSINTPISEAFKVVEKLKKEIEDLEFSMDGYDPSIFNAHAEALSKEYRERMKGANSIYRAMLQGEYDTKFDELKVQYYDKPRNELAIERHKKLNQYKIWDSALRLYIAENRSAIDKAIEDARNTEIKENLASLVAYIEG